MQNILPETAFLFNFWTKNQNINYTTSCKQRKPRGYIVFCVNENTDLTYMYIKHTQLIIQRV